MSIVLVWLKSKNALLYPALYTFQLPLIVIALKLSYGGLKDLCLISWHCLHYFMLWQMFPVCLCLNCMANGTMFISIQMVIVGSGLAVCSPSHLCHHTQGKTSRFSPCLFHPPTEREWGKTHQLAPHTQTYTRPQRHKNTHTYTNRHTQSDTQTHIHTHTCTCMHKKTHMCRHYKQN